MTTPWKTWMRERLPSTTRTWTFTESPGRKSGMSARNESASSASRVFIAAVLSLSSGSFGADSGMNPLSRSVAATPWRSAIDGSRRSAAALYCATSSVDDARRPSIRPADQLREQLGEPRGDERLGGGGDLLGAPPAVRLVLVGLDVGLPADVD